MEIIEQLRAKIRQQPNVDIGGSIRRTLSSDDIRAVCGRRLRHDIIMPHMPFSRCPVCASHLRDALGQLPYCPVCGHPPSYSEYDGGPREFRCHKVDILHPLNCIGQCIYVVFQKVWWGGVITEHSHDDAVCVSFLDGTKHELHLQQRIWRPCGSASIHMPVSRLSDFYEPPCRGRIESHVAKLALAKTEWTGKLTAKCQESTLDVLGWRLIAVIVAYLACPE